MESDGQNYQGFQVKYYRRRQSSQWEAKTILEQGPSNFKSEGVKGGSGPSLCEGQTEADVTHDFILVSVQRDPRFFDLSPELEEARIAMTEKANEMADAKFLERHPGAEIEHRDTREI